MHEREACTFRQLSPRAMIAIDREPVWLLILPQLSPSVSSAIYVIDAIGHIAMNILANLERGNL